MCSTTTRWWSGIPPEAMLRPIAIVALLSSCANRQAVMDGFFQSGTIHLHCTWTDPYCGGAEPDPADYPRPQPWSGKMFIRAARPDSTGKLAINDLREPTGLIQMNREGDGYLALPPGQYLLIDADRADDRKYRELLRDHSKPTLYNEPIDTACLRQWLIGPFGVCDISSGDTLHVDYPLYGKCPWHATPCVRYNGPLPP